MPSLAASFVPSVGPIVNLAILPPGTALQVTQMLAAGTAPPLTMFSGLIDTGASATCIAPAVASAVGLVPRGRRMMASATHAVAVNVYVVDLILPMSAGSYALSGLTVLEFQPGQGVSQILLGRDVLCQGVLTLSFDGHMTFSV